MKLAALLLAVALAPALLAQSQPPVPSPAPSAPTPAPSLPSPLADPAAYVAQQFGPCFKYDPRVPPMVGDLDSDGRPDLVLVARCKAPLTGREQFAYKVLDPYDSYFGNGNIEITSQFSLHFDGSERAILVIFDWQNSAPQRKSKDVVKHVLINTPFDKIRIFSTHVKKKSSDAIGLVEHTSLNATLVFDGRRWRWIAGSMDGDADDQKLALPREDDDVILPKRN